MDTNRYLDEIHFPSDIISLVFIVIISQTAGELLESVYDAGCRRDMMRISQLKETISTSNLIKLWKRKVLMRHDMTKIVLSLWAQQGRHWKCKISKLSNDLFRKYCICDFMLNFLNHKFQRIQKILAKNCPFVPEY